MAQSEETLLFEAIQSGSMEGVRARLEAGDDVHARDAQGRAALDLAFALERYRIARALLPDPHLRPAGRVASLALGASLRLGKVPPADVDGKGATVPCIAKKQRTVQFCVEEIAWPAALDPVLRVRSHLYRGAWAIVRYDGGRATYGHALFPNQSMAPLVAWVRQHHGDPTRIFLRRAPVFSRAPVENPTLAWDVQDPATGAAQVLEIRRIDDTRGGFANERHGVILLYESAAEPVFPRLSAVEVMGLRVNDPKDDGGLSALTIRDSRPLSPRRPDKARPASTRQFKQSDTAGAAAKAPPRAPPTLAGPNPFDPDTRTASPLPTVGPVEEPR